MVDVCELNGNGMEKIPGLKIAEENLLEKRKNTKSEEERKKINFRLSEIRRQISFGKKEKKGGFFVSHGGI